MRKKQLIIFIILIGALFALNGLFINMNNGVFNSTAEDLINHDVVSSQKLFENIITNLNLQIKL